MAAFLGGLAIAREPVVASLAAGWTSIHAPLDVPTPAGAGRVSPPVPAPVFSLPLFGGGTLRLAEQRGRVVVVTFWASWCVPCRAEAPRLATAAQAYRGHGVRFVGINLQDRERDARAFLRRFQISFPNGPDRSQAISAAFGVVGIPTTVVIDRQGLIRWRWFGEIQPAQLESMVDETLR